MRAFAMVVASVFWCLTAPGFAADTDAVAMERAPGKVGAAVAVNRSGTITAIDAATRTVTILAEDEQAVTLVAGPDVRNFAQLRIGDRVDFEYREALTLELKPGSTAPISRVDDAAVAGAAEGEAPAGIAGRRVTVVAEIVGLDAETSTVTLKGPNRTIDLPVADPAQFALMSIGDRIQATYVEAIALSVTRAE